MCGVAAKTPWFKHTCYLFFDKDFVCSSNLTKSLPMFPEVPQLSGSILFSRVATGLSSI